MATPGSFELMIGLQLDRGPEKADLGALVIVATLALPYTPLAQVLGFGVLPVRLLLALAGSVAAYVALAETVKAAYFRKDGTGSPRVDDVHSRTSGGDDGLPTS